VGWDRVFEELKSPWDWAAAFTGGAFGSIVSAGLHVGDLGHAVPTGALTAIAARRAWVAGRNHHDLLRRANSLLIVLIERNRSNILIERLRLLIRKGELKAITDEDFDFELREINKEDSSGHNKWTTFSPSNRP
jgi:hypothetical protein